MSTKSRMRKDPVAYEVAFKVKTRVPASKLKKLLSDFIADGVPGLAPDPEIGIKVSKKPQVIKL